MCNIYHYSDVAVALVVGGAAVGSCRSMFDAIGAVSLEDIGGLRTYLATLLQSGS